MNITLLTTNKQLKRQEKIAVKAVSQCYQSDTLTAARLPKLAILEGHRTILEFFDLTFLIEGISYLSHVHLIRHRHTTPMVQSQRYTNAECVVNPMEEEDKAELFNQALFGIHNEDKIFKIYAKPRKEELRYLKPQGASINMCLKMNLRAFLEMIEKRTADNVLAETKEVVNTMYWFAQDTSILEPYLTLHTQYLNAHNKMMRELKKENKK